jgi:ribosomal-protein-serine acetyltransferase
MILTPEDYPTDGTITLRPYQPGDEEETLRMVLESLEMLQPWMSWAHEGYSIEEARAYVQSVQEKWQNDSVYSFVITDAQEGVLLGGCGLGVFQPAYRLANLGYWVRQSRRGQGIAPRAARMVARWGMEQVHLLRAEIVVAVGNTASLRVAKKCGATREGVLRSRMVVGDKVHDAVMHSLIPQDFGIGQWISITGQGSQIAG